METGLLHLHNALRWVILVLLIWNLIQALAKKESIRSSSLWLMITAHTMLLIGIYQAVAGRYGWTSLNLPTGSTVMSDSFYRFFLVEHPVLMVSSIVFITMARAKAKELNFRSFTWLLVIALVLILAGIPWPGRELVGRPLFPGA
ncbi:MAG: hypothetical protein FJY19_03600 [Bacteroidetes bacterium]|nr:hypothetical protein [Bacteroidota bacterium]